MIDVAQEADRVYLDLGRRGRDLLLSPLEAHILAGKLELCAELAEREPASVLRGESWGARVTNRDRQVVVSFDPPPASVCRRIPLTARAARVLAGLIESNANLAAHGLRIERG